MKENKPEIIYSSPVQEIISNPPGKLIRRGIAIISSVFIFLIFLSWLIRYPDIIPASIEITTVNPPVTLSSKITGRINTLYVTDGEKVSKGKLLAVMETTASIAEIEKLKRITDSITKPERLSTELFPSFSDLGEFQNYYASFMKSLSDYNSYIRNDYYGNKMISISEEIDGLREYVNRMKVKESLISDNLSIEKKKFRRDSILFSGKVSSEVDFELSRQSLNTIKLELQQTALDRSAKIIELAKSRQLLQDYKITREQDRLNLLSELYETYLNLTAQIKIWENKYLLISPVDGTVTFTKYWTENQSVLVDQPVLNIVPEKPGDFIGRIFLNMQRSGKVKEGLPVNIKLSGFPYLEFGMLRGFVRTKSLVPSGDAYVIEVTLPDGLRTLYGNKLEFTQNMQGTAEIITDNLRLIQKIINPFRHLASKNKI